MNTQTKEALEMAKELINQLSKEGCYSLDLDKVINDIDEALEQPSNVQELQFIYDDLTEEYIAELDEKTALIIYGGNRGKWFNKIRGIWYE